MKTSQEYAKDFYAWTLHNAKLIREGKFAEVDLENVAEEIESMGRSDKRESLNQLAVLVAHLLKWQYQPARRGNSWRLTIKEQRIKLISLLDESPSLQSEIALRLNEAYSQALVTAARQTGLIGSTFPIICPFNFEQCLNHAFIPE